MTASRVLPIAAAAALLALLLFALLFLLLNRGGTAAVELTGEDLVTTVAAASIEPTPPAAAAAAAAGDAAPLRVYVAGAVQKPGVYTLNPGDRLADAVAAAGGIAATADLSPVNLALKVQDEGRYLIPDIATRPNQAAAALPSAAADLTRKTANLLTGELSGVTESGDPADNANKESAAGNGGVTGGGDIPISAANSGGGITVSAIGLLDLNTATDRQLETLPGIGPSRARAIIAHRNQHGPFVAAEELTAVAGIGPGIYGNLQSLVSVAPAPAP